MTENELVRKIIYNANKEADEILAAAVSAADEKLNAAQTDAAERKKKALALAEQKMKQKNEELTLAGEVENIKQKINIKQEIMQSVFDGVKANIQKANPTEKQKLIAALRKKYGQANDKITNTADGGIIVSNKNYDIDLSLSVLLDDLREGIESDIAKMLF
jgi:vacuolar-type H+-ATPase subunit E/Vma4